MPLRFSALVVFVTMLSLNSPANCEAGFDAKGTVKVVVDASDSPRRIQHVQMSVPVRPGPLTLLYPKWIPGDHGPTGPINEISGFALSVNGEPLEWKRDPVDMFIFYCEIPNGAEVLEVKFDHLGAVPGGGHSWPVSESPHVAVIDWNPLVFYPAGVPTDDLNYQANLRLPRDWKHGSALPLASGEGDNLAFKTVSLTTLIDSPVIAGRYFSAIDIAPGQSIRHTLDIAADSERALKMSPETIQGYQNLVNETYSLFNSRHYREYHFLVSLSDPINHFGLEHHESSVNRLPELTLVDPGYLRPSSSLLPHEMVHSWNGKHRRPKGLANPDYQTPMQGELLWIYEGLTTYLGRILTARAGLWTPDEFRSHLAVVAATSAAHQNARNWRSLADSAITAQQLYKAGEGWTLRRRGTDDSFYDEGELIWLEVDALIREGTAGKKSLDDFCKVFYGKPDGKPSVIPYELSDVVAALNAVHPSDWASFFKTRVYQIRKKPPLEGVELAGWRLAFNDQPSTMVLDLERLGVWGYEVGGIDMSHSIGLTLASDGTVRDVVPGLPADVAGVAPGTKILGVNGRKYSEQHIRQALKSGKATDSPVILIVENDDFLQTVKIDYHGGERYPILERIAGKPDRLSEILKPASTK